MGNCGSLCTNALSRFKGDIIMEKLTSENRIKKVEEIANNEIKKVIYLQRKIKQFLQLKNISYNNNRCSKQKQKMGQMEDNDNNLIIRYNSNLQNKLTSAKSQTFKNSSLNNHNESSHKEKFSKQSFHFFLKLKINMEKVEKIVQLVKK